MINKTIIQGRLIESAELKKTQNDASVANFRIAWSEQYKDLENKCFLNCVAWRGTAEFLTKYFSKGQELILEGKLITRNYKDKEGNNRSITELICDSVHFCGKKQESNLTNDGFVEITDEHIPF